LRLLSRSLALEGRDLRLQANLDAELLGCLYEHGDEIGVKRLEGAAAPVEHLDLCARSCGYMRELEGDVAAADGDDAARKLAEFQKLRAGCQVLLTWDP